ncbi:MAG TPA: DUF1080 domain-containing protein [Gemmatimonadaceae bacterium]|jgi:hypothetical protein
MTAFAVPLLLLAVAAPAQQQAGKAKTALVPNTLSPAEEKEGWKLLFDGSTTNGWRGFKLDSMPSYWMAMDGTLMKDKPTRDIITKDTYKNFELQVDWKVGRGGNAGIFYRGTEEYDAIYWSAPEYQLLDDKVHPDGKNRLTAAAAVYGMYPSPAGYVHAANEWNHTRLVVNGDRVEHWLNGHKMVSYTLGSKDWAARVAKSKFKTFPNYGKASEGHIGFQGGEDGTLALRNIKIRVLP